MARDFSTRTDIDNTDPTNFPDGRIRNSNPPSARNGTAIVEEVLGDLQQLFLKLLRDASITPNGSADTDSNSQFLNALVAKMRETTATELLAGAVIRAIQSEVNAGTNADKYVSPATLNGRTATESRSGIAPLATQDQVNAGTDANRIITPATFSGRTATQTRSGISEIATVTEINAGTDQSRILTAGFLNQSNLVLLNNSSSVIRIKTVDIGDWNMNITPFVTVAHGLGVGNFANVLAISAVIQSDGGGTRYLLTQGVFDAGFVPEAYISSFNDTNITLTRRQTGFFDAAGFSSTAIATRGTVTIIYTD